MDPKSIGHGAPCAPCRDPGFPCLSLTRCPDSPGAALPRPPGPASPRHRLHGLLGPCTALCRPPPPSTLQSPPIAVEPQPHPTGNRKWGQRLGATKPLSRLAPSVPQFPLWWYLTWSVLPQRCGPLGAPGPASRSCPCPAPRALGPGGHGRAGSRGRRGVSRLRRGKGSRASPGPAAASSLFSSLPPQTAACVCFPGFLTEGILPSWLPAPRVVTPGPTLQWQPQPGPFQP